MDMNGYITEDDVKRIVKAYSILNSEDELFIERFHVCNASDKMLGFLADYLKLKVYVRAKNENYGSDDIKTLHFFVKAIPRENAAKAAMVRTLNLFEKEADFYNIIKNEIVKPGIGHWSPKAYAKLSDALVLDDMNAMNYQVADKFKRFDWNHAKCAISALAKFHAGSILYEHTHICGSQRKRVINDDFKDILSGNCFFHLDDPMFKQCMNGALIAVTKMSKYNDDEEILQLIHDKWRSIWSSALKFDEEISKELNVICHCDLWNNNILFHYKEGENSSVPDDAIFVDYQGVRYQPAASDLMLLLYCNMDPKFREDNMTAFIKYYYQELESCLKIHDVCLESLMTEEEFFKSAERSRKWGLILCACLILAFYLDEAIVAKTFTCSAQFEEIMKKNKASFIIKMMNELPDYKKQLLLIFEEIVERYCNNVTYS